MEGKTKMEKQLEAPFMTPRSKKWLAPAGCGLLAIALAVLLVNAGGVLDALKAAGAFPEGGAIAGFNNFVTKIQGNILWIAATVGGAAVALCGLMFVVGHTRAQDIMFKTMIGFAIIAGCGGIIQ